MLKQANEGATDEIVVSRGQAGTWGSVLSSPNDILSTAASVSTRWARLLPVTLARTLAPFGLITRKDSLLSEPARALAERLRQEAATLKHDSR